MTKFRVGDKVKLVSKRPCHWNTEGKMDKYLGKIVKITHISASAFCFDGSEFWWFLPTDIESELPQKQSIHIYHDGKTTTAKLCEGKEVVKTATAICHPDDKFDFEIGAELAFGRLFGREPEQPSKPELPKVREVKRRAKVGEWVKIVDPVYPKGHLGKIVQCQEVDTGGDIWVIFVGDKIKRCMHPKRYVVLEGYEPPSVDWDAFKQGKFAVNCDTEEKANAFLKECEDRGLRWASGQKATAYSFWRGDKGNTCYQHSWANGGMQYSSKVFYAAEGTPIVPYR